MHMYVYQAKSSLFDKKVSSHAIITFFIRNW